MPCSGSLWKHSWKRSRFAEDKHEIQATDSGLGLDMADRELLI